MAVAKEIRGKIDSIENTKKITGAMEMVAASKKKRAIERMEQARPYADKIRNVIGHFAFAHPEFQHIFLEKREIKRAGYIVVTTDRGLCGGLNALLLRATLRHMNSNIKDPKNISLALLGKKAEIFFHRVGGNVIAKRDHLGDEPSVNDITGLVKVMLDAWRSTDPTKRIDALYLCSNKFVNTMQQAPTIQKILPIEPSTDTKLKHYWDYIYEPDDAEIIINKLLTRYIESQVYRVVIENIACEQAARMIAMKNATDNASDLIRELDTAFNKARQAAITRELTEIVAGASVV